MLSKQRVPSCLAWYHLLVAEWLLQVRVTAVLLKERIVLPVFKLRTPTHSVC